MARRMVYNSSEALSRTSPYLSRISSILRRTSGKDSTAEAISLSSGYCPSLQPLKKARILRRASREPRSTISDGKSIWENGLRSGTRKGMQSPKPELGNPGSNIKITRISSARPRRRSISAGSMDTISPSALSRPYPVEQRAATLPRSLSKPSLASILTSFVIHSPYGRNSLLRASTRSCW